MTTTTTFGNSNESVIADNSESFLLFNYFLKIVRLASFYSYKYNNHVTSNRSCTQLHFSIFFGQRMEWPEKLRGRLLLRIETLDIQDVDVAQVVKTGSHYIYLNQIKTTKQVLFAFHFTGDR